MHGMKNLKFSREVLHEELSVNCGFRVKKKCLDVGRSTRTAETS